MSAVLVFVSGHKTLYDDDDDDDELNLSRLPIQLHNRLISSMQPLIFINFLL